MRILGIDPGIGIIGFGVIDILNYKMSIVSHGTILTPPNTLINKRLITIFSNLSTLIEKFQPTQCAIEEVFFSKNVKTAISVSHARGVILLALEQYKVPIYHYSPTAIKSAVTGYGGAEKAQMQFMVKELLKLDKTPKPDDAADALAVAICHHHSYSLKSKL